MLGIILIILGVIGKIVQANAWFVIPNIITTGLFVGGGLVIAIQIIITLVIAKKSKAFHKNSFDKFKKKISRRVRNV